MRHPIAKIWNDKLKWFRDDRQVQAVRQVIELRLADDRFQEECRYLMRFHWHLIMSYCEVTLAELIQNVSQPKMRILVRLFDAIVSENYLAIDDWIAECDTKLPFVEDHGSRRSSIARVEQIRQFRELE